MELRSLIDRGLGCRQSFKQDESVDGLQLQSKTDADRDCLGFLMYRIVWDVVNRVFFLQVALTISMNPLVQCILFLDNGNIHPSLEALVSLPADKLWI